MEGHVALPGRPASGEEVIPATRDWIQHRCAMGTLIVKKVGRRVTPHQSLVSPGKAAGQCDPRGIAVWCWWTFRRSAGRFVCGGGNVAGLVRTLGARFARSFNRIRGSVRCVRC